MPSPSTFQTSNNLPTIVIGFGGHARVVASALQAAGRIVLGATDLAPICEHSPPQPFQLLTDQAVVERYQPGDIELVLGIGSVLPVTGESQRVLAVDRFGSHGFRFCGFQHPTAWVAPDAKIGTGVQIHAGAIVQSGAVIGDHTILNTGCIVDHDCRIGEFCHLAPGVVLSGEVTVGDGSHVGTGAIVIQSVKIGQRCLIAAGATVVGHVLSGQSVRGTPAKPFTRRIQ